MVGKSSIITRFVNGKFSNKSNRTINAYCLEK